MNRRKNFNGSMVYETPQFSNSTLRILGGGWRISGIVRLLSGGLLCAGSTGTCLSSGLDQALTGTTGNPSVVVTDQNFGRILPAADPRIMQFALKFVF